MILPILAHAFEQVIDAIGGVTIDVPDDMKYIAENEGVERAACDYIAGMTDHFAVELFQKVYVPKFWKI